MSEYLIQDTTLTDIADAIRGKTGKTDTMTPLEMPGEIASIQGGGGGGVSVSPKEVNFIDYDGTVLYAYTVSEAAALTELPPLPSHAELICQGWNWSLDDIKALGRSVVVGAMYITDDGKTRLYITIPPNSMAGRPPARSDVPLYISQTVTNGVTIDWGDGSPTETLDGTGSVNTTHHYDEVGDYVITLEPGEGAILTLGHGSNTTQLIGSISNLASPLLNRLEIGKSVVLNHYAFSFCYCLRSVTIPVNTEIRSSIFKNCYSLFCVVIPDGVADNANYLGSLFQNCSSLQKVSLPSKMFAIGTTMFYGCTSLREITLPDYYQVNIIESSAFRSNSSLRSVVIPSSITQIQGAAFYVCSCLSEVHLLSPDPPSLYQSTVFDNSADGLVFYVPAGSLEAYQTATNWSAYADQMQEEPS